MHTVQKTHSGSKIQLRYNTLQESFDEFCLNIDFLKIKIQRFAHSKKSKFSDFRI